MRSSPFIFKLSLAPPSKPLDAFDSGLLAGADTIEPCALLRDLIHECMLDLVRQADGMSLEIRAMRLTTAKISVPWLP